MKGLEGMATLVRLALRRERFIAPAWIFLLVLIVVGQASNYIRLFPDAQVRQNFVAEMSHNRVLLAFAGQIFGPNLGALIVFRVGDTAYTLLALMVILTVLRHTRAEEESGRQELLGAGVLGRYAPLTASLLVACCVSAVTGALTMLGLIGLGLDPVGSLAFGLALAGIGCVFAALAALAAQLTESTRTSTVISMLVLVGSYMIRFVADGSGLLWLKWLSPNGWSQLIRPFGGEQWGVLALILPVAIVGTGVAYLLVARRDLGGGILPARPGPASGPSLRNPLALAWRLHRGLLLGWVVGYATIGVALAGMATTLPEILRQSSFAHEFLSRYSGSPNASVVNIFLEIVIISLAPVATFYSALATLRLRFEEVAGRAEFVLSTPVSRISWVASHLVFSLLGTGVILAAGGGMMGLVYGLISGNLAELPRVLAGILLHLPAVWLLAGIAVLLFGCLPRFAAAITWVVLLYVQLIGEFLGPVLFGSAYRYQVVNAFQPFHWVPKITSGGAFTFAPLLVLLGLTILLTATGLLAFQRRDVG